MATWRSIGSLTPDKDSWLWFEVLARGNFFRLVCSGVQANSSSFLQLQDWPGQKPGPIKIVQPLREQVFHLGQAAPRLIAIRKAYPVRSAPDSQDYQVTLFEWEEAPRTDPEVNLWVPGKV